MGNWYSSISNYTFKSFLHLKWEILFLKFAYYTILSRYIFGKIDVIGTGIGLRENCIYVKLFELDNCTVIRISLFLGIFL